MSMSDDFFVLSIASICFLSWRFATARLLAVFYRCHVSCFRLYTLHVFDMGVHHCFVILRTFTHWLISLQFSVQAVVVDATTMPKYFLAYCPRAEGTPCKKGTQKLGSFYEDRDARQAIYNHLYGSTHHQLSDAEATEEADKAELCEMEYQDDEEAAKGSAKAKPAVAHPTYAPRAKGASSSNQRPIGASTQMRLRSKSPSRARDRSRSRAASIATAPPPPEAYPAQGEHSAAAGGSIRRFSAARLGEIVRASVGEAIRGMNTNSREEQVDDDAMLLTTAQQNASGLGDDQQACWNVAVGALVKIQAAAATTAKFARQAADAFDDQARVIGQQIDILQRTGYMPRRQTFS